MGDNAKAWELACTLFGRPTPTLHVMLAPRQRPSLDVLKAARAVRIGVSDSLDVLCPGCFQWMGPVERLPGRELAALACRCRECGVVPLEPESRLTVELDTRWLAMQLRLALDVSSDDAVVELAEHVWRLGTMRRQPVVLARSVDALQERPGLLARLRQAAGRPVLAVTPQPAYPLVAEPFDEDVVWLPLRRGFVFDGKRLNCIEPAMLRRPSGGEGTSIDPHPVHGPFSEDFRWVTLAHGLVHLSPAQGGVMEALWWFRGEPQRGEVIMARARLKGSKPGEVFKVKPENKGKPQYDGPKQAYETLVVVDAREGTYALPWPTN